MPRRYTLAPSPLLALRPWQRHSQVLAVAGFVYIVYGIVAIGTSWDTARVNTVVLATYLPAWVWMSLWCTVGSLALASTRWPPSSKTWGYVALAQLAAAWSLMFATGLLFGADPAGNVGGTVVWALVSYLWYAISGLINPDDVTADG